MGVTGSHAAAASRNPHDQLMAVRRAMQVVGILLAVVGGVFTLQGIGVLGGSFMSGSATWAVIGIVLVITGLVLYARATRTR
jgi:hypothetical protein